jgi:hypothetical protein
VVGCFLSCNWKYLFCAKNFLPEVLVRGKRVRISWWSEQNRFAIEDWKQLGEGIPSLAPNGKESGTWRIDFTLILILKPVKRLERDFTTLKLAPLAPFRDAAMAIYHELTSSSK